MVASSLSEQISVNSNLTQLEYFKIRRELEEVSITKSVPNLIFYL
jgi:hypothetical protein